MRREEVIRTFCGLVEEVNRRIFPTAGLEHDCFCGDNPLSVNPIVHDRIMEFILASMQLAMDNPDVHRE